MTTSGPVVDLPNVPSKAGVGRVREAQSKGDEVETGGEKEAGFGEVLSKLQSEEGSSGEDASPVKGTVKAGEHAGRWRHEAKTQTERRDGNGDGDAASVEALLDSAGSAATVGGAADATLQTQDAKGVSAVSDLAAAFGLASAPVAAGREVTTSAQGSAGAKTVNSGDAIAAALEASTQAAEATESSVAARSALASVEAGHHAGAADPMLAKPGARAMASAKDKAADSGETIGAEADAASVTFAGSVGTQPLEQAAATPKAKANIVRQETHFAPVASGPSPDRGGGAVETSKPAAGPQPVGADASANIDPTTSFESSPTLGPPPAQQIADRIATEAASAPTFADRAGAVAAQPAAKPALKVLHIALQPVDLGAVTVRMELKDAELVVHVEAERAETAELIRNDQDTLSKLLRSAGYAVDAGGIRVTDSAPAQPGQNGTQTNLQSSAQSQSGASERQEQPQRGNGGSNNGDSRPQASRNDAHETTDIRAGGGVYI